MRSSTAIWIALLSCVVLSSDARYRTTRTKVLILGAGVAGINAANTLRANGIEDFLILEAQDYIGGRFKQADVGGLKIEEGANWVHHVTDDNPVWKLKEKYNLRGLFTDYSDLVIRDEKGADVSALSTIERFNDALEKAKMLSDSRIKDMRPDMSLRAGLSEAGWKPSTPVENVIEYLGIDFEYPDKPEMNSFRGLETRGKDFFVVDPRGYGHIWREMAKEFRNKIILNTVIKEVMYSNTGVTVKTVDGKVYRSQYAICTFSTGVLASDMVKFTPKLPQWKMEAIYKVPMRFYTKIFLQFPYKFWDNHEFILYAHRTRGYYPIWMDIDRPSIAAGSKVLHITMTGDDGHRVEAQSEKETQEEIMKELRKVYGDNIPNANRIFYSKWSRNPYTRGSFPNKNIGTTDEDFHNLQGNVKRLYFAGDAVDKDWWGYVQSAYLSGTKKAHEIMQCLKGACEYFHPKANIVQGVYISNYEDYKLQSDSRVSYRSVL